MDNSIDLQRMIENAPVIFFVFDKEGIFTYFDGKRTGAKHCPVARDSAMLSVSQQRPFGHAIIGD